MITTKEAKALAAFAKHRTIDGYWVSTNGRIVATDGKSLVRSRPMAALYPEVADKKVYNPTVLVQAARAGIHEWYIGADGKFSFKNSATQTVDCGKDVGQLPDYEAVCNGARQEASHSITLDATQLKKVIALAEAYRESRNDIAPIKLQFNPDNHMAAVVIGFSGSGEGTEVFIMPAINQ